MLGLELDTAVERLNQLGFEVELVEVRSRKGQQGNQNRVIKQEQTGDNRCKLSYSAFITETKQA